MTTPEQEQEGIKQSLKAELAAPRPAPLGPGLEHVVHDQTESGRGWQDIIINFEEKRRKKKVCSDNEEFNPQFLIGNPKGTSIRHNLNIPRFIRP